MLNLRSYVFTLAVLVGGCATTTGSLSSPWDTLGAVNRSADGQSFTIYGLAGADDMSAVTYLVPDSCLGKEVTVTAEYRTPKGLQGGTRTFQGVHFDYEMRRGGLSHYPHDYLEDPSSDWRSVSRTWSIPVDANQVIVRVGLQGVSGQMDVRNLHITCTSLTAE